MRLLARLLARRPDGQAAREARREWDDLVPMAPATPLARVRWVALDTETSGLNPERDRPLSIGACAIEAGEIRLSASFEVVLRQYRTSAVDNVLVHGIGHQAQGAGQSPDAALAAFLRFARTDPVVGYHTLFDLVVLRRAIRAHLGIDYRPSYIDLALVLPPLAGRPDAAGWDLDRWLTHYGIGIFGRHQALGDALAAAQLFQLALGRALAHGLESLRDLERMQARQLERAQARG
jgi:DNA polymerase-3 subunit epsilon